MRSLAYCFLPLLLACRPPQPTTAPVPASAEASPHLAAGSPLSATTTRMWLGNALDTQQRIVEPLRLFTPRDTFFAVIQLDPSLAQTAHTVRVQWSHLDSRQTILEESKPLTSTTGLYVFQLSNAKAWPAGQYKVETFLDDHLIQTRLFEVQTPSDNAALEK